MAATAELLAAAIEDWVADPDSDVVYSEWVEDRWAVRMTQTCRERGVVPAIRDPGLSFPLRPYGPPPPNSLADARSRGRTLQRSVFKVSPRRGRSPSLGGSTA